MADLLPRDALKGQTIGISVSDSPDLSRLGFMGTHIRLAVGEIARVVLVAGGRLAYGGHLEPEGFTVFLTRELDRYGRNDRPLLVMLALQEHRRVPLSHLRALKNGLGLKAEIVCLDRDGQVMQPGDGRGEDVVIVPEGEERRVALTSLRREMVRRTNARILIGGKRHGFQGAFPGLVEEAAMALEAGQPLYLAGGFGGIAYDISIALELDDGEWMPHSPDEPAPDPRTVAGLSRLREIANQIGGIRNGLTADENRRLAASHRPSDIAALISIGVGRLQGGIADPKGAGGVRQVGVAGRGAGL